MIRFIFGVITGVTLVILYPDILTWFVDSGSRDAIIDRLKEL